MTQRQVKYRGISNAIVTAINMNKLTGQLTFANIRPILPEGKQDAPEKTICKTLDNLVKKGAIVNRGGRYFTREAAAAHVQAQQKPEVSIHGKLVKTEMLAGKITALVEVTSLEYK